MQMMLGLFLGSLAIGVSLISGIFGGIGFWQLILRSLLSGVILWIVGIIGGMFLRSVLTAYATVNNNEEKRSIDIIHEGDGSDFEAALDEDQFVGSDVAPVGQDTLLSDDDFTDASLAGLREEDPINIAKGIQTILESEKK